MKLTYDSEVEFNARQIIRMRGLDGAAQKELVHTVARMCDAYVPFRSGPLKNTVQELPDGLLYNTPYAHYQYVGILMVGEAPKQYYPGMSNLNVYGSATYGAATYRAQSLGVLAPPASMANLDYDGANRIELILQGIYEQEYGGNDGT